MPLRDPLTRHVAPQRVLALLVQRVPAPDLLQAVPHQELVVARREEGRGDVDQDGDPRVVVVAEDLAAEEDGRHDASPQVTREVRADRVAAEAPDHVAVREADGVRHALGGDERVSRVETGPYHQTDEAVDEEFDEEEVAFVRLVRGRNRHQRRGRTGVADETPAGSNRRFFPLRDLDVVLAHEQEAGDEGAENLGEDKVGDLAPGEGLPVGEADGDSGVEVAAGGGGANDDGESNADSVGEADGEEVAERWGKWGFHGVIGGKEKGGCRCDTRVNCDALFDGCEG